jgi:hypothetical protein
VSRTSLVAVAVSAALGLLLGAGAGLALGGDDHPDPLGLGIPLVNQHCTGKSLLLLGWGESGSPLGRGIADHPGAQYLDSRSSCATMYPSDSRYVAYLGPYSSTGEACRTRMSVEYRGDVVTRLHAGNTEAVECGCYIGPTSMPTLRVGAELSLLDGLWVRELQKMLTAIDLNPPGHLTGFYDQQTADAVARFQSERGLTPNGVVDVDTWRSLQAKACLEFQS